jgi:hypothetical protein
MENVLDNLLVGIIEIAFDRFRQLDVEALSHPEPGHGVVDSDWLVGKLDESFKTF